MKPKTWDDVYHILADIIPKDSELVTSITNNDDTTNSKSEINNQEESNNAKTH